MPVLPGSSGVAANAASRLPSRASMTSLSWEIEAPEIYGNRGQRVTVEAHGGPTLPLLPGGARRLNVVLGRAGSLLPVPSAASREQDRAGDHEHGAESRLGGERLTEEDDSEYEDEHDAEPVERRGDEEARHQPGSRTRSRAARPERTAS